MRLRGTLQTVAAMLATGKRTLDAGAFLHLLKQQQGYVKGHVQPLASPRDKYPQPKSGLAQATGYSIRAWSSRFFEAPDYR